MAKELPLAPIKRILKAELAGKQIADKAVEQCAEYIEEEIAAIGSAVNRLAEHEGRKLVREKDMLFILDEECNF